MVSHETQILPVIKANGYGHSMLPLAKEALRFGVPMLGVGTVAEGVELRKAKIAAPLLLLDGILKEEIGEMIKRKLTPVISSIDTARLINKAAAEKNVVVTTHLKFDTGMSRMGFDFNEPDEIFKKIKRLKNISVGGIMTHLASSPDPSSPQTEFQIARFERILEVAKKNKVNPRWIHAANSGGVVNFRAAHYNMVRAGLLLYGISPSPERDIPVKPLLTLKSALISVKQVGQGEGVGYNATYVTPRKKLVGVVMGGYADGIRRSLSNNATVVIDGKPVPIIGTICMDSFMVDLSRLPTAAVGDEVTIIGGGHKETAIDVVAERAGTIPYEIVCGLGNRVERIIIR